LLGETYEFVVPGKYSYFAEQVSHHPPICAYQMKGESGYIRFGANLLKNKFTRGTLNFFNIYKEYIELTPHNELFELRTPNLGVHNIIFGQIYLDLESNATIKNVYKPEQRAEISYTKRTAAKDKQFIVNGKVFSGKD
jgi:hypothetical protein